LKTNIHALGNYIDYKYFDKYNVTPRYPFGHGLSYTTFNYSALTISPSTSRSNLSTYPTGVPAVGGNSDLWTVLYNISMIISNTGSVDGAEVPQLYVSFPDEADKPVRELRGFERVVVSKGGESTVNFELMRRDLSYWDVVAQQWALAKGTYTLSVGASSRDLRSTGSLIVA
jgi:beta-glucosidase